MYQLLPHSLNIIFNKKYCLIDSYEKILCFFHPYQVTIRSWQGSSFLDIWGLFEPQCTVFESMLTQYMDCVNQNMLSFLNYWENKFELLCIKLQDFESKETALVDTSSFVLTDDNKLKITLIGF